MTFSLIFTRAEERQKRGLFSQATIAEGYHLPAARARLDATSLSLRPTHAREKRHEKHGLWCLGSGSSTTPATLWHKRGSGALSQTST